MSIIFDAVGSQITEWGINSGGYFKGTTGTVAQAASSGMGRLYGQKSKNLPLGQARNVAILGDNALQGTIILPTGTPTTGELVNSIFDPVWATSPIGGSVNTVDGVDLALLGIPCPVYKSLTLVQNSPAQNMSSGSQGQPGYMVEVWPNVFANPRANLQTQDATAQEFTTDLVASSFGTFPWGVAPTSVLYGATQGVRLAPYFSPAAWTCHVYVSDGSTPTFTLANTPYAASAAYIWIFKNGSATKLVYTSGFTVSAKIVTLASAGSAADIFEVWYGYTPVC